MTTFTLTPLNDFDLAAEMRKTDLTPGSPTFGKKIPLTTGTVTAFLSTSNLQTATVMLEVLCTHLRRGIWLAHFDASVLTVSLLDSLFGAAPTSVYCHFVAPNDIRKHVRVTYSPTAPAEVP